jgi:hypothetical protein
VPSTPCVESILAPGSSTNAMSDAANTSIIFEAEMLHDAPENSANTENFIIKQEVIPIEDECDSRPIAQNLEQMFDTSKNEPHTP